MSNGRWQVGAAEVENLIDQGEIDIVEPSPEHAHLLMRQAETHLASVPARCPRTHKGAFALIYDAARKSTGAVLARQGLRTTSKSGHRATHEAIEAQLGPNARTVVRPFRGLGLRRHDAESPSLDTPMSPTRKSKEALEDARDIVEAMKRFLPNVGPGAESTAPRGAYPRRTPVLQRLRFQGLSGFQFRRGMASTFSSGPFAMRRSGVRIPSAPPGSKSV